MFMSDRQQMELKKKICRVQNKLSKIEGIELLEMAQLNQFDLRVMEAAGVYDEDREPDVIIPYGTDTDTLAAKLIDLIGIENGQVWYMLLDELIVGVKILDEKYAMLGMLKTDMNKAIMLISEDKKKLYDFGLDSRGDDYIFDVYDLK
ncbi:MAG: hypothetical protein J6I46_15970 [Ruminococcus sp.]|nr:hypothetical protein [Ruminococcus sp.]